MGPYKKKLVIEKFSLEASQLDSNQPMGAIIALIADDERRNAMMRDAEKWVDEAIQKVMNCHFPNNQTPNEEQICKTILDSLEDRRRQQKRTSNR